VDIELKKRLEEKEYELRLAYAKIEELTSRSKIQNIAA
jgi:hypothetical protein